MKISADPNKGFQIEQHLDKLVTALKQAEMLIENGKNQVAKVWQLKWNLPVILSRMSEVKFLRAKLLNFLFMHIIN